MHTVVTKKTSNRKSETIPVYSANAERAIALVFKPSYLHMYLSLNKKSDLLTNELSRKYVTTKILVVTM